MHAQPEPLRCTCPDCGRDVEAYALESTWGAVFVGEFLPGVLREHARCDLMRIGRALRERAKDRSRVLVFGVFRLL
jgi:hypothetical protein